MWKTPQFWISDGAAARALTPAAWLYGLLARRRLDKGRAHKAGIPVICVGNLTAGGAGKTPVALLLGRMLLEEGRHPHFLARGYGGRLGASAPVRVDAVRHGARDVGDEALLLGTIAPCWVSADRARAASAAHAAGADAVIMDDGFQNPALHKDLAIVVVDGEYGFGNGRLIPAGPLREPAADGLARAHAALLLGEDRRGVAALLPQGVPLLRARLAPSGPTGWLQGLRAVAFAGIGRPEKFFSLLESLGCEVVERAAFADHHVFREAELRKLQSLAERHGAQLVTTEKDRVRLPREFQDMTRSLPVEVEMDNPAALRALLAQAVTQR